MQVEHDPLAPVDRPDLEEFLSALNGFLEKQTTPQDPSYQKFLEIFCRTLGAAEGNLLKSIGDQPLASVVSFGIGTDFDEAYNAARSRAGKEASPFDRAFSEQRVVAMVEIRQDKYTPSWFTDLMGRYGFRSLVAVPLLGQSRPVGILCAYYHDLCLFDQGTLDRLLVLGRMVGAATEKSQVAGRVESANTVDKAIDDFLALLLNQSFTKAQIYGVLSRIVAPALNVSGFLCGPVRAGGGHWTMTVADGVGVAPETISQRLTLPRAVASRLVGSPRSGPSFVLKADDIGTLADVLKLEGVSALAGPLLWHGKPAGAAVAWRPTSQSFEDAEVLLFSRLIGIAALALNAF